MGEEVTITTVANQQHKFYKISSGALRFQVRGMDNAGISLTERPKRGCEFWIVLGRQGKTMVLKDDEELQSVATPHIITPHEFNEFWIQWCNNQIALGRGGSNSPFLVYKKKTFGLNYITFAAMGYYELQWKFELPPLLQQAGLKALSSGVPEWKQADDQLPDGALIGGYEKEMLYIIRARHQGSLTPGKFVPSEGISYISWGGSTHEKGDFEVLCGYNCIWIPCSNGRVPAGAVKGGHSEATHEPLFVGRALYNSCLIPGKVQPSHKVCYIPYGDREIAVRNYEILVVPEKNMLCANPFFMHDIVLYETNMKNNHEENYDIEPSAEWPEEM